MCCSFLICLSVLIVVDVLHIKCVCMSCFQGSADKLKAELHVVEAEKKELQEHYLEAMQRVSQLETELDKANVQTRLLENKLKAVQGRCEKRNIICHMFPHL